MRVTITAATVAEWMPSFLNINALYTGESQRLKLQYHQSGIGMLAASYALTKLALEDKPDLIIQVGIAGSFDQSIPLGSVVVINEETIGDLGVEEEGKWKDLFDLKLEKSSYHPFEKRKLPNQWLGKYNLTGLKEVGGITVNEISTHPERIQKLIKKFNLGPQFILAGWRRDIPRVLSAMDVFVLTSLWEGLPIAVLEAMVSQVPVVATHTGGISEIITEGKTGFLVSCHDMPSMLKKIPRHRQ